MALSHNILATLSLIVVVSPLLAALCALVFKGHPGWLDRITVLGALISLLASTLAAAGGEMPLVVQSLGIYLDELSVYFMLLVNLVAFVASWYAIQYLRYDARHNPHHDPVQFHFFFNLFHVTMLVVPMVANLIALWIAVELTTVVSTVLVRYRRSRQALEASWKFIVTTTTGVIFALLGTLFLTSAITPETTARLVELGLADDPMRWAALARKDVALLLEPDFVMLSFLFILIGYGAKAGLAPMHTWLPDGHGEAPSPVSALLSGVMLKSALYAILRFYTITNLALGDTRFASTVLLVAGLFSLVLATPFILKRNRFKRVLAYHSLEHMGIITFGVGIGGPWALFGALLHALNHALTKALMFMMFGYIHHAYTDRLLGNVRAEVDEAEIRGVGQAMPLSAIMLAGGGLALVGSPPFNIFMSEFIILWAAIQKVTHSRGSDVLLTLGIAIFLLTVTLIFGGLIGHLARLLLGKAPFEPIESGLNSLPRLAPFFVLFVAILWWGVTVPGFPADFPRLLERSAQILTYGVLSR